MGFSTQATGKNLQKPAKSRIFGNLETYVPFHRNLATRSWMETSGRDLDPDDKIT
jgi:hypothetical protein